MRELETAQRAFGAALADATLADDAARLFSGAPERVLRRLAVYRGNVIANTGKALAAAYPIIRQLVGDEFFDGLARVYGHAYPPASGDLNEYGAQFAPFLDGFAHTRELAYLPDVARLEWLVHRAHYAADHAPLDLAWLGRISEPEYSHLGMKLHSSVALLESPFPLGRIWEVHQRDYAGEMTVDLDSGSQSVLVYRPRFRVAVAVLVAGEYAFLQAIAEAQPLGGALECAVRVDAHFDLGASLQRWIATSVVIDMSIAV